MPLGQAVLTSANPMGAGKIALFIIGMIVIIVLAYYTTYLLGSKSFKLRSGRNIILRDRFAVSKDKSFYVIEAYGKVYIVGVTSHSMTVIDSLGADAAAEYQEAQKQNAQGGPSPFAARGGLTQRMINGMAGFIAKHILKRGDVSFPNDRYDRGDDFNAVYRQTMTDRDEEQQGAEDEE